MKTTEILYDDLTSRIAGMQKDLDSASSCLIESRDYLQCAVRLQDAAQKAKFEQIYLHIMDSMSEATK
jgi:hypothetical protein